MLESVRPIWISSSSYRSKFNSGKLGVLGNRNFRCFYVGYSASLLGTAMSSLVVRFPRTAQAQAQARSRSLLADLADGWAEFSSRAWLCAGTAQFALFNLLTWGPYLVLGPVLARDYLGGARAWAPSWRATAAARSSAACSRSAAGQRPAEQAPLPGKDDPLLARGTQVASGQRSYGASGPKVHTGVT